MSQVKTGVVVSKKMTKTVVVRVVYRKKHPLYKKMISKARKFKARDEIGVNVQDKVKIAETRPLSKDVRFKVMEVIK